MKNNNQQKFDLITDVTSQNGSCLAEFFLEKGYIGPGIKRHEYLFNIDRINQHYQGPHIDNSNFILHCGDLSDLSNLALIIQQTQSSEIYNFGVKSLVAISFDSPEQTVDVDSLKVAYKYFLSQGQI